MSAGIMSVGIITAAYYGVSDLSMHEASMITNSKAAPHLSDTPETCYNLLPSYQLKYRAIIYNRRPLRPPFLLVESVGIGVTSSASKVKGVPTEPWHHAIGTMYVLKPDAIVE